MIYIIIPVHNRKYYTQGCLDCLEQQTYRDFTTIVVDDGSTDGTVAMIDTYFPDVIVLRGDGNLWWTKAINMGVQYALDCTANSAADVVLTLNDDLAFGPNYLASIMASYEANKPCLIGSAVVDITNPDYLEYAGVSCNYFTAKWIRTSTIFKSSYQQLAAKHAIVPTDDLPGRGTIIPLNVFEAVGLYDEQNFPHYMADVELSVRARRKGYRLFVSVGSVIHNYTDATRNKKQSWQSFLKGFFSFKSPNYLRSRYAFAVRHAPLKQLYFLLDLGRMTTGFLLNR
ncbi:glycosyltransferase family 2 protein [Fibrella sp. HMF5335]|uniref:Glycosyltransferase family 2 protein n=1 Tax=Fibrella rubiginis TaxID=2817060 RepID=A0A939GGP8_9BACT|nr:glycosyltransferase family 2 protein [Fibrella rubiginis]MBO0938817.1 glycosyltransferase family 2 protein [Fibrella rubiginis]